MLDIMFPAVFICRIRKYKEGTHRVVVFVAVVRRGLAEVACLLDAYSI